VPSTAGGSGARAAARPSTVNHSALKPVDLRAQGIIEGIFLGVEQRPAPAAESSLHVRQLYSELPNARC